MKKQNVRTLTLIVSTFSYLLVGAAIFDALESQAEDILRIKYQKAEETMLITYNITDDEYKELEDIVIRYQPHKAGAQWKFPGAFYFSLTVITTIGYGHSCPTTVWGKSFCMLYAVIGIPLCLVMFQSVGERLNNFASWCIKTVKKCLKFRHYESTQTELVIVGTVLAVGVVTGGAAMFNYYEKWSYFNSVYFCFITLTTIGFGDFVALQSNEALNNNVFYVVLSMTFILFGLTVVASSMNLLVLRFLTMNTEDERREEIQSAVARSSLKFESDLLNPNGTFLPSIGAEPLELISTELTPSESEPCSCFSCFKRSKRDRKKFTVRRMPSKVAHLVPMKRIESNSIKQDQPSTHDSHHSSTRKLSPLNPKSSLDESLIVSPTIHPPLDTSTSISSLKICPIVTRYQPQNVQSQIDFQENLHWTSARFHLKRSSV